MTDDDPALNKAMKIGFCKEDLRDLLCKWHVLMNLRKNLVKKKVPNGLWEQMFFEIKVLMNTRDEEDFKCLTYGFVMKYEENDNTAEYIAYFKDRYLTEDRWRRWAMCFRKFPHGKIKTTGHVESFHNRLKKYYLKRKVNKRVDDLIDILIQLE